MMNQRTNDVNGKSHQSVHQANTKSHLSIKSNINMPSVTQVNKTCHNFNQANEATHRSKYANQKTLCRSASLGSDYERWPCGCTAQPTSGVLESLATKGASCTTCEAKRCSAESLSWCSNNGWFVATSAEYRHVPSACGASIVYLVEQVVLLVVAQFEFPLHSLLVQ